jgi:carboxypeptidase C (cathepsin A)
MLFISQPLGVGFSYSEQLPGSLDPATLTRQGPEYGIDGRWPVINVTELGTTQLASVVTWHALQGFLGALPQLNPEVGTKKLHLWTSSYGGHFGPTFMKYFYDQNQLISNGSIQGIFVFGALGVWQRPNQIFQVFLSYLIVSVLPAVISTWRLNCHIIQSSRTITATASKQSTTLFTIT